MTIKPEDVECEFKGIQNLSDLGFDPTLCFIIKIHNKNIHEFIEIDQIKLVFNCDAVGTEAGVLGHRYYYEHDLNKKQIGPGQDEEIFLYYRLDYYAIKLINSFFNHSSKSVNLKLKLFLFLVGDTIIDIKAEKNISSNDWKSWYDLWEKGVKIIYTDEIGS